jgi:hypothetical protein
VALDHADMVIIFVMTMFVFVTLVEVGITIFSNNTLTFNIRIINHWWYIHTSSVEDTVYLVLPHTIAVITAGCKTDLLDYGCTTMAMAVMMVTMPVSVFVSSIMSAISIDVTNFGFIIPSFSSVMMAMSMTMTLVTMTMMVTVAMCQMVTIVNAD